MMRKSRWINGYTLIEIIVALLIFTVGLLALAASSAVVARAMAKNGLRERGARIAASRIEVLKSQCAIATSGHETVQQIESDWAVIREPSRLNVVESVHCLSSPASCIDKYPATMWCRP
jgi:prepilin-type N-terminal cleavage/methylation domain-containing protein